MFKFVRYTNLFDATFITKFLLKYTQLLLFLLFAIFKTTGSYRARRKLQNNEMHLTNCRLSLKAQISLKKKYGFFQKGSTIPPV